jgi:hypothetical protein
VRIVAATRIGVLINVFVLDGVGGCDSSLASGDALSFEAESLAACVVRTGTTVRCSLPSSWSPTDNPPEV